jgi:mono/diheme cytochrome c family protein
MKRFKKLNYLIMVAFFVAGCFIIMSMSNGIMQNWPVPAKYKSMKNTKAGAKDTEGIGKSLYTQHCASCHGTKAMGDGKKAAALKTEMKAWNAKDVQAQTDGDLYYKSFVGKGEMPNFEKKITAEGDRWLLINYIRTFKAK